MGGRGSAGGVPAAANPNVRTVQGISVDSRLFAKESDVAKLSKIRFGLRIQILLMLS